MAGGKDTAVEVHNNRYDSIAKEIRKEVQKKTPFEKDLEDHRRYEKLKNMVISGQHITLRHLPHIVEVNMSPTLTLSELSSCKVSLSISITIFLVGITIYPPLVPSSCHNVS